MTRTLRKKSCSLLSSIGIAVALFPAAPLSFAGSSAAGIKTLWRASTPDRPLKSWSLSEIQALKSVTTHEKDSESGSKVAFRGPEMSNFIDQTIASLPAEEKAQLDMIIVRDSKGAQVQIPRWLFIKYPVVLSAQKDGIKLVLPLTSKPKIKDEGLPLARLQFHEVAEIEFANTHQLYGSLYLKRRMDPSAVRGEKIFIQNCTSCHGVTGTAGLEKSARKLASSGHPPMMDAPQLKGKDIKALESYLEAWHLENPTTSSASSQ